MEQNHAPNIGFDPSPTVSRRGAQDRSQPVAFYPWRLAPALLLSLGALLVTFLVLLASPQALRAANPHYVAPTGVDSSNCSISTPCRRIQQAVANAVAGDEIRAAAGLYTGTVTLGKNLTLQGGFTTTNWITPNPSQNPTIIDAQNSGSALDVSGGVIATVNGFHLTGGNSLVSGGGVNNQGILTLTDDRIYGNTAFGNGGGIANGSAGVAARLTLSRSRIYSNTASLPGGGLAVISGTVLVEAAEIFSNSTASGVVGGGISVVNGDVTVRSSLVYRNSVSNNAGGGIWIQNGNVKLENNTIYDNRSANGQGGGIGAFQGTVAITNNLILTNTASISGGGIYNYGAALNVAYTDFFGNSPDHMADGSGTINPTTFGSNNRISNPLLVNPPAFDLHLTASSPAIDSGTASTAAIDIDGQGRPFVVTTPPGMDRGADEYYPAGNQCYARLNNSRVYTNVQDAVNAASPRRCTSARA
jgi:parallel beta-helix repeat protein